MFSQVAGVTLKRKRDKRGKRERMEENRSEGVVEIKKGNHLVQGSINIRESVMMYFNWVSLHGHIVLVQRER